MKRYKFFKIILLVLVIIVVYSSYKIYSAKNNFNDIYKYSEIQIPMNGKIIWDNSTVKSISVKNNNGQPIKVYAFLSPDKKTILINPPVEGYTENNLYYITISTNIHMKNYKIGKDKVVKFKAKDENLPTPKKVKREPEYGDIIGTTDKYMGYTYDHYGVYVGNNRVIHYCSTDGKVANTKIQETSISPYFRENNFFVLDLGNSAKFSANQTVKRARSRLGEQSYDLLQNNCEHFSVWTKTGNAKSYQIDKLSSEEIAQVRLFMTMGINLQ
ncbi:lecithin retinol acyltransferase family protein [Clostridium tyrobutyricum]|uniref:lecithin retinol acyltransferase family protein n=1 Tax=Clostridium tyrobutyricum TaxID=1519 RepID=UPI001C37F463|nr:lecithin retinol acyltransferase family protein [Clostridium tyrobutyricum]MBV4420540.1 lecithin retinol acyltransferase family protein [Clostridium tyrobutyricum]